MRRKREQETPATQQHRTDTDTMVRKKRAVLVKKYVKFDVHVSQSS
jgi:hypothetical protein